MRTNILFKISADKKHIAIHSVMSELKSGIMKHRDKRFDQILIVNCHGNINDRLCFYMLYGGAANMLNIFSNIPEYTF